MTDNSLRLDDGSTVPFADERELARDCRTHPLSKLLAKRLSNRRLRGHAVRLEGGLYYTATLRRYLRDRLGVRVGAYSYGPCLSPGAWPEGVTVGRYASIAPGVLVFRRNHPLERLSLHPFFYNRLLGYVEEDTIESAPLFVGHDAWIGANAIITPGCARIGIGAVIGAGSVVTKDVADFAVVGGNPARVIKHRFDDTVQREILESRWWERPVDELASSMGDMLRAVGESGYEHPVLRQRREAV